MVVMYDNFPVYWRSSLQTEIALSTAEAEYIALSSALREVLSLMTMMEEINEVLSLQIPKRKFFYKVHEDNQTCIKMSNRKKLSPRTEHISLKYHHFRTKTKSGRLEIQYRPTNEKLADILTKPFPNDAFFMLHYMFCGRGYAPNESISN